MKLIAYQNGDRRVMARVVDDMALPFASLEDFWADPQQNLLAAAKARSGGEPVANLVQVPPLPGTARVICAGLNYAAHAEEAHFKLPNKPDIFGRWRSTLAVDGQPVSVCPRDDHFDWEGELAVVIGKELRDATPEVAQAGFALSTLFGILDASPYRLIPQVVVAPRIIDDIIALLNYCRENGRHATFRACGTSLCGQSQSGRHPHRRASSLERHVTGGRRTCASYPTRRHSRARLRLPAPPRTAPGTRPGEHRRGHDRRGHRQQRRRDAVHN